MCIIHLIRFILELIGFCTVVWFLWVVCTEYQKIKQKENEHG